MKAFRGTLVALVVLVVVGAFVWTQRPAVFAPEVVEGTPYLSVREARVGSRRKPT